MLEIVVKERLRSRGGVVGLFGTNHRGAEDTEERILGREIGVVFRLSGGW
jgi:hypothetical protein